MQTLKLSLRPFTLLRRCSDLYGEPFTIRIVGNRTYVVLSSPNNTRDVLAYLNGIDPVGIGNDELRPALGDNSLLLLDGSKHKEHRKILAPPFSTGSLCRYATLIHEITERISNDWEKGSVVPIFSAMREISLEIILSVALGSKVDQRRKELRSAISRFVQTVNGPVAYFPFLQRDFGPWSPGGQVFRAKRQVDLLLREEIIGRRKTMNPNGDGVLGLLLKATNEAGDQLSDQEIQDELITILLAGHDPTTAALAWMMHWIHSDTSVAEKVREEMSNTSPERLDDWHYLDAVCNETLRIYPMFPTVERKMRVPVDVMGYTIDPGIRITPCIYLIHRCPELYPEPDRFRPERFLERRFAPHEFLPFGLGNRRCIGGAFAPYQMKIVISSLLRRFDFEALPGKKVKPVIRGASMGPSGELRMRVTAVRKSNVEKQMD